VITSEGMGKTLTTVKKSLENIKPISNIINILNQKIERFKPKPLKMFAT
jgi:hypothetical protein